MPQAVLAMGVAVTTASGCVWYVPALVDLRAGADRPVSRRSAAAACLIGWGTTGCVAVLLLVAEGWWIPSAVAALGIAVTAALRIRAAVEQRRERREVAVQWTELRHDQPPRDPGRPRKAVAVLIGCALTAASVPLCLWAVASPDAGTGWWALAAVPSTIGLSLVIAVTYMQVIRRPAGTSPALAGRDRRPPRR
ncbi:hypothetical protein [Streptomyces sp. HUAS TT20]|uniref:hypothetical protein n=1 Tax=Streptomyces sp. HUAS TT20 TaxID=3447509 RepID=UPI0021DA74EA|nr:hypothetical protein [Streptomyces sp. HUAS 15-9]UXY31740.1 hypothetical protein N8I87_37795 [Streptomyces sp. HUAS 15-9]